MATAIGRRRGTTAQIAASTTLVDGEVFLDSQTKRAFIKSGSYVYPQDKTLPSTADLITFLNTLGSKVETGQVFTTAGKTTEGDGGGGQFIIEATGTANGGTVIALADGRFIKAVGWDGSTRLFCVGDGITDDTEALQAAADAAAGDTLHVYGTPLITDTITIPANTNVYFHGGAELLYDGNHDRPAILIKGTHTDRTFRAIRVRSVTQSDWSSEDYVGVVFESGLYRSEVEILRAQGFTIGAQFRAVSDGIGYNRILLGILSNNKYQLDLQTRSSGGWVNENLFLGGDYTNSSVTNTSKSSYGVRFSYSGPSSYKNHNNNIFIKPCFELSDGESGVERVPVLFAGCGRYNRFRDMRVEGGRGPIAICDSEGGSNLAAFNTFALSTSFEGTIKEQIEERSGAHTNELIYRTPKENIRSAWEVNDLASLINAYDATRAYIAGDLHIGFSFNTTASKFGSGLAIRGDALEIPNTTRGIGVFVDTTLMKRFAVLVGAINSTNTGRVHMVFYGDDGAIIPWTTSVASFIAASASTNYSGSDNSARVSSDGQSSVQVVVSDAVKKVRVLVIGGSVPALLKSIAIVNLDKQGHVRVWSGLDDSPLSRMCSGDPSSGIIGKYVQGEILYNQSATSGQPSYYQCTTAGRLAPAHATETDYEAGQYVLSDTNKIYKCVTAGTTGAARAPTGTGTGITDGTAEWDYVSPKAVFTAGPSLS